MYICLRLLGVLQWQLFYCRARGATDTKLKYIVTARITFTLMIALFHSSIKFISSSSNSMSPRNRISMIKVHSPF